MIPLKLNVFFFSSLQAEDIASCKCYETNAVAKVNLRPLLGHLKLTTFIIFDNSARVLRPAFANILAQFS